MNRFSKFLALAIALATASPMALADTITIGFAGGEGQSLPYSTDGFTFKDGLASTWNISALGGDPRPLW